MTSAPTVCHFGHRRPPGRGPNTTDCPECQARRARASRILAGTEKLVADAEAWQAEKRVAEVPEKLVW